MHKAFINDKPLIFDDIYKEMNGTDSNSLILSDAEFMLDDVIKKIEDGNVHGIIYLSASPDQAWTNFARRYVLMEAAGGLVVTTDQNFLVIYRKKKWDLPKGKLDYNESPESAAIREVKEECGIKNIELGQFLLNTFHTYTEKNKFILKKTHWYLMKGSEDEILIPQAEEDIEKVKWMSKEKILKKVFPETYQSIKDVFLKGFEGRV